MRSCMKRQSAHALIQRSLHEGARPSVGFTTVHIEGLVVRMGRWLWLEGSEERTARLLIAAYFRPWLVSVSSPTILPVLFLHVWSWVCCNRWHVLYLSSAKCLKWVGLVMLSVNVCIPKSSTFFKNIPICYRNIFTPLSMWPLCHVLSCDHITEYHD